MAEYIFFTNYPVSPRVRVGLPSPGLIVSISTPILAACSGAVPTAGSTPPAIRLCAPPADIVGCLPLSLALCRSGNPRQRHASHRNTSDRDLQSKIAILAGGRFPPPGVHRREQQEATIKGANKAERGHAHPVMQIVTCVKEVSNY